MSAKQSRKRRGITWTTTKGTTTSNIGNVTMHYVNDSGLEIDRTASLTDSLSKTDGTVVKISDWVNDDENSVRKVSGYKYVRAAIGTYDGKEITAVKVMSTGTDGAKTVYKLYYTDASDPDNSDTQWTEYKDSVSGNNGNNADIYLVFHSTAESVNVHFVDEDGKILINPIYHYANETYEKIENHTFNIKITTKTENPWYEPIQNYTFTGRAHVGETGWQGFAFSRVQATKDDSGNYRYQYSLQDSGNDWTDLTATDVYLIYKKTNPEIPLEIQYIKSDGTSMQDEAGNSLNRTVDMADWYENDTDKNSEWLNLQGFSETVNGYAIYQRGIFKTTDESSDYTNYKEQNQPTKGQGYHGDDGKGKDNIENFPSSGSALISGRPFNYLRYVKDESGKGGTFQVGNGWTIDVDGGGGKGDKTDKTAKNSKINRYWDIKNFTLYLVYNTDTNGKTYSYRIHHVDESGNNISNQAVESASFTDETYSTKTEYTIGVEKNVTTTTTYRQLATNISGYTPKTTALLGRPTLEQGGLPFTTVKFTKEAGVNSWKYQINGKGTAK